MLKTRQNRKATASPVPAIKTTIPSETIFPVKPQETPKITPPQKREDLPQQVVKPPQKKSIQTNPTLNPKSVGFNKKAND